MTLYPSWAVHHSKRIIGKEFWFSASSAIAPPAMRPPRIIQGVRLPKRERVRSEKVPKITFASRATTEPTALIVPSIDSLPAALMFSSTAGKMTEVKATQGIAQATALRVKPTLRRMRLIRFSLGCRKTLLILAPWLVRWWQPVGGQVGRQCDADLHYRSKLGKR